jgi:hypothetical protein
VGGCDSHLLFRQKLVGEDGNVRRRVVMVEAGLFSPKFGETSSQVFTQSPQNVAIEPGIQSFTCSDRCFAPSKLLYRWRHKAGIFWIPSRVFVAIGCCVAALNALVFGVTTCQTARCHNAESQLCESSPSSRICLADSHIPCRSQSVPLPLWRRNFLLNFSTPCI